MTTIRGGTVASQQEGSILGRALCEFTCSPRVLVGSPQEYPPPHPIQGWMNN